MATTRGSERLEIRLLGPVEVVRGGGPVALPASKKARALLAYLVATHRPHAREQLCGLLWDAADDPRAALRWTLTKIRPLVDDPELARLVTERNLVRFEPTRVDVDVLALRTDVDGDLSTAPVDALRRAAGRFRGEFLEGLDVSPSYRFYSWCVGERDALRARRLAILGALVQRLQDRPEEAVGYARERVGVEPLSDAAYVDLVRSLGALGRTGDALREYDACKRLLERELGVRPSADLELARAMLPRPGLPVGDSVRAPAAADRAPVEPASPASPQASPDVPLVGREAERALLEKVASHDAAPRVVLLLGDPGIGKTRLLEEFRALAVAKVGLVLSGRAFEAERVRPYGPWIDALRSAPLSRLSSALRCELGAILPELGVSPSANGDRTRLFEGVARALAQLGGPHGLALVFDDLQWFDEGSAALLHFISREAVETRRVIVCAARGGELADNRPVLLVRRSLQRNRRFEEIVLAPLDAAAIRDLVLQAAPTGDADRVFAESGGNPLFALEIVRAVAGGEGEGAGAISESFDQLLQARLDQLAPRAAELLPWAAALGRSFRLDVLEGIVRMPAPELLSAVEDLERRAIVRPAISADGSPGYDFVHDLVRDAAYRRVSGPLRQLVHRRTAQVLAALADPFDALAGDVARHASLGGEAELCARASVRAANHCLSMFANAQAAALADFGLRHVEALADTARIRLAILLLRVHVESGLFRLRARELEGRLRQLALEAQSLGLHGDVAVALHYVSELREERGDFSGARESTLLSAEASRASDPATTARTLATTGRCLAQIECDMDRAESMLLEAQAIAVQLGIDVPGIPVGIGIVRHHRGDEQQAIELLELGLSVATRTLDHWIACDCLTRLTMIDLECGRPERALERCRVLLPMAEKMGEGSEAPLASALQALAELQLGLPDAAEALERSVRRLREIDTKGHFAYVQTSAAMVEVRMGLLGSARSRAEEALAAAEIVGRPNEIARARALLAKVAIRRGDPAQAAAHLDALAEHLARPLGISEQVRAAVASVAREIGTSIPNGSATGDATASHGRSGPT